MGAAYLSLNGAELSDLYMSCIHTAELCGATPFDRETLERTAGMNRPGQESD